MSKLSRKALQAVQIDLLGVVGDVLRFAAAPVPVALDGLGQDHRRLALVVDRVMVGRIDLERGRGHRG